MRRDTLSGMWLIAGALALVLVAISHPTGHELMSGPAADRMARLNVLVHALALATVPILFMGFLGLTRYLQPSESSVAALVVFGFACAAVTTAAVASGLVAPEIIQRLRADESARDLYHGLLWLTGVINHGFAAVHIVASSAAILLWSSAILRGGRMPMAAGIVGLVAGAGVLLGFLSGQVGLDVHGFAIMMFAQAAWIVWVGILLVRVGRPSQVGNPDMS